MSEDMFNQHLEDLKKVLGELKNDIESHPIDKFDYLYNQILYTLFQFKNDNENIIDAEQNYDSESIKDVVEPPVVEEDFEDIKPVPVIGAPPKKGNIGKPIAFSCFNPTSPRTVHNTVLVGYIDNGHGYYVSHCKSYSTKTKTPDIEYLNFHTPAKYAELKKKGKITHLDWIYYEHKIHPNLKPHQVGFWYAYNDGKGAGIEVHDGIFDYVIIEVNGGPSKPIYNINEAKKHVGKIILLHYSHYDTTDPKNPHKLIYHTVTTPINRKIIDLGPLPKK